MAASPTASRSTSTGSRPKTWRRASWPKILRDKDGILVPGGFGIRGIEGKIRAVTYRPGEQGPLLRHLPGDAVRDHRVRPERGRPQGRQQHGVRRRRRRTRSSSCGGSSTPTMTSAGRCASGEYVCQLEKDSFAYQAYRRIVILERHRHRFEFNPAYKERAGRGRAGVHGQEPRLQPGRDHRAPRPPVVPGLPVPSGVQVQAPRAAPALQGFHRSQPCPSTRQKQKK